jgi:hypothetical protein
MRNYNIFALGKKNSCSQLFIDLNDASICGIKIGEPISKLSFLGPSDRSREKELYLGYRNLGLTIDHRGGMILGIDVNVSRRVGWKKYSGCWLFAGKNIIINDHSSREEIEQIFGLPSDAWDDGVEKCLIYEINEVLRQFIWSSAGRLKTISLDQAKEGDPKGSNPNVCG